MRIDMGEIKNITIKGFRGINTPPLELDFKKDKSTQSMMIYGKNGSGKSSIVDAWEWLHLGKIQHLAREDARENAYQHKEAQNNQTWIEVDFTKEELGKIRAEFDPRHKTMPKIEGNLSAMTELIPAPCHLRYRDLNDFVYETKARKYEILASQMGFGNAVDIQNQIRTGANQLNKKLEDLQKERDIFKEDYQKVLRKDPNDKEKLMETLNTILNRHGIATITRTAEIKDCPEKFREQIEKDDKTRRLSQWENIQDTVNQLYPLKDIRLKISKFQKSFTKFKQDEESISKIILLDLYEKGIEAIDSLAKYDTCPLCDQPYEGNLVEHIKSKQSHLDELNQRRNTLENERGAILLSLSNIIEKIQKAKPLLEEKEPKLKLLQFNKNLKKVFSQLRECREELDKNIESISKEADFHTKVNTTEFKSLIGSEPKIKGSIAKQVEKYQEDESKKALVDDFQKVSTLVESFGKWTRVNKKISRLEKITKAYEKIEDDYIKVTQKNIQCSFNTLSDHLKTFFNTIEKDTTVLDDPKIRLFTERDKAVELEIMFGGERISPAYKFLSESQLNSFGLSIFLASIRHLNPNFKFIILDDIINSFDGYKRPYIIDLLSDHFSDYQILLLTHDLIWLDRLQKRFPQWIRKHFLRWDYAIGPIMKIGKNSYEQIEEFVSEDKATEAGQKFGIYLEFILQELCENLEASVKYNRRNEYNLSELFQAFEVRFRKKLGLTHSVFKQISGFGNDRGFRNFCAHWKDTEIPYTSSEISNIVEKWKDVESELECAKCHRFVRYEKSDGFEHISCPCRKHNLTDPKYYK